MKKIILITAFILSILLATFTEGNSINIESIETMPSTQTFPISDSYAIKRISEVLNDSEGCAIDLDFITTRNYSQNKVSKVGIESYSLITTNKEFFISIVAQNVKNIRVFQVCLLYNPEQLKYISAYENSPFAFTDPINNFLKKEGGKTLWMNPSDPNGKIVLSSAIIGSPNEEDAPDGSGIIAFIAFELLTQKKDIDISLSEVFFIDVNDKEVNIDKLMNAVINPSIIQPEANFSGIPTSKSVSKDLTITVSGLSIVSYKYQLDSDPYSEEYTIDKPIVLQNLPIGLHTISVIGKSSEGTWQAEETAVSESWVITQTSTITQSAGCAIDLNFLSTRNYNQNSISTTDIESSAHIELNQEFFMAVVAQNVNDLKLFKASLLYNPEEFQYISSHENFTFPSDTINNFLKKEGGTTLWMEYPHNTPGELVLCSSILGSIEKNEAPDGSGIIAFVKFKLLSDKKNMNITLSDVHFVDINNNDVQIEYLINAVINPDDLVPTNPISQSHTKSICSEDNTIEISWSDPDISDREIKGYSVLWDNIPDTLPEKIMNTTNKNNVSQALPDGNYYVHIRIVDSNNVWSNKALHDGPYCVKTSSSDIPTPQGLTISETSSQKIELKWYLMGADYTYNVYKSDSENGFYIKCDPFELSRPEFIDNDITDGILFWYRITAVNSQGNESLLSNAVSAKTESVVSGVRLIPENSFIMQLSGLTATYHIQVSNFGDYSDDIQLSVLNLNPLIKAHFNLSIVEPPAFVKLSLEISNTTPVNRYTFNVHALGNNCEDKITLSLDVEDPKFIGNLSDSAISSYMNKKQIFLNEPVDIYGNILPLGENTPLSIHIQHESQDYPTVIQTSTNQNNSYQYTYTPDKTGIYTFYATWEGNKSYNPDQSPPIDLTVLRGKSKITCQTPDREISPDDTVLVTGKLLVPTIANEKIVLKIVNPDGVVEWVNNRIFTESDGSFKYSVYLNKQGIWNISSCWQGNEQFQGVVSTPLRLYPGIKAGKALIVAGGGMADNNLWPTIQYLTTKFYRILLNRKFSQEMIYYMSPDIDHQDQDIVINDQSPTVADIQNYIVSLYENVSNPEVNSERPLLIFMADHGGPGTFKVNRTQILKAKELDTWLDQLQAHTSCPVYLIMEFCFSGTFVNILAPESGQKRVLITSTGDTVSMYDNDGRASFSQYLFNQINSGYSLDNCFYKATAEIRDKYLFSNQIPRLFDGSDGLLAQTSYIGGSFVVGDILPEITSHTPNQTIVNTSCKLFVKISDVEGIDNVWASIMPPNMYLPETTQVFETPLINVPKIQLVHQENGRYEGIYNDFTLNGIYRVTFYCEDTGGNVVSKETVINVAGVQTLIPGDLDGNGHIQLRDVIIAIKNLAGENVSVVESSRILCNGPPCEVITLLQIMAGM